MATNPSDQDIARELHRANARVSTVYRSVNPTTGDPVYAFRVLVDNGMSTVECTAPSEATAQLLRDRAVGIEASRKLGIPHTVAAVVTEVVREGSLDIFPGRPIDWLRALIDEYLTGSTGAARTRRNAHNQALRELVGWLRTAPALPNEVRAWVESLHDWIPPEFE